MKKPLPVRIVEAIGWTYVALVVLLIVLLIAKTPCEWPGALIAGSLMLSLPICMVFSLRTGQRFGFVVPNVIVSSLAFLICVTNELYTNLAVGFLSLILLIVPDVLLCLSSSRQWMRERAIESTQGRGPLCVMAIRSLPLLSIVLLVLFILSMFA